MKELIVSFCFFFFIQSFFANTSKEIQSNKITKLTTNELIKETSGIKLLDAKNFDTIIAGQKVMLFTLRNSHGVVTQITNFGGRVVSLWTPDKNMHFSDIVAGFKTIGEYFKAHEVYFGALIGRYGNRIKESRFTLDNKQYMLISNDGDNQLHGGPMGFHNVIWEARKYVSNCEEDVLELKYTSKDGEQGYPGELQVTVLYTLTNEDELKIEYFATTDKKTVVNLTHHSFFNLHGFSDGAVLPITSHLLKINGSSFTPTDNALIPTGEIVSVENTPFDFTKPTKIGKRINEDHPDLLNGLGYDHNWVLNNISGKTLLEAAVIYEPLNGRQVRVLTDQPGLQFYSGNFFKGLDSGKYNEIYTYRSSFALETQHFPDSPNQPTFPSTILLSGDKYHHLCIYKFEIH